VIGVDACDAGRRPGRSTSDGGPPDLRGWQEFAADRGKPLSVPEWGLDPFAVGDADNPGYVRAMHAFLARYAARPGESPAGRVIYDICFGAGVPASRIDAAANPRSGAAYRALPWGAAALEAAGTGPRTSWRVLRRRHE
jgi:hypothetical protein